MIKLFAKTIVPFALAAFLVGSAIASPRSTPVPRRKWTRKHPPMLR